MSETAPPRSLPTMAASAWLHALPPLPRFLLQGNDAALGSAARALGLPGDSPRGRAVTGGAAAFLWLGPDERLILGATSPTDAGEAAIHRALVAALDGLPHSLVDVSHRQVALRLAAPFATDLLNCGCPQDLDVEAFPLGACSRTLFGKAEIVLWRRGADEFHLEVWRSFADYLTNWLIEAAQDLQG